MWAAVNMTEHGIRREGRIRREGLAVSPLGRGTIKGGQICIVVRVGMILQEASLSVKVEDAP
jgi:hypothetical protein